MGVGLFNGTSSTGAGSDSAGAAITQNIWHHIVVVGNGTSLTFYVDGTSYGGGSIGTLSSGDSTRIMQIGAYPRGSGLRFNGKLDDVRIYNRALSASEVTQLYQYTGASSIVACNTVNPANFSQSAYNAYGAPYDLFASNAQLVDAKCTSADMHTIAATIGKVGDTTRIVYTKGYYYNPGISNWAQYASTCTGTLNGDWCAGPTTTTITDPDISTASAGAPAYFVGMVCSVQNGGWKCGCRDTSCTNFYWQIQGAGQ